MNRNKLIGISIGILIIILTWIIASIKISIFPSILQIIYNICTNLVDNLIISSVFNTVLRAISAFLISLSIGIITASLSYKFTTFNYILKPIISLLRSIPTISLILIVIMLVKLELITYIIVILISYPIIYQNVYFSLNKIDSELILINRMDNTNSFKNYFLFYLPMTYSGIVSAIIQTFGLSIKIQIMSELLTGSTKIKGIGVLLNYYKNNLELDNLFSITALIIIIVFIIEYLFNKILKSIYDCQINLT